MIKLVYWFKGSKDWWCVPYKKDNVGLIEFRNLFDVFKNSHKTKHKDKHIDSKVRPFKVKDIFKNKEIWAKKEEVKPD